MKDRQTRFAAVLLLSGALFASGCKSSTPAAQNANEPSATPVAGQTGPQQLAIRNQDGSITNPDGSVTYPPGVKPPSGAVASGAADRDRERDRQRQEAQNGGNGRNQANGAGPGQYQPRQAASIPVGTPVTVRLNGGLAASRSQLGDRWTGTLERPITSAGQTMFPSGTEVSGQVVAVRGRGRFKGAGDLGIALTSIGRMPVQSSEYEQIGKGRGKRSLGFAGGGAGLGALIGGLAGGGKGALIGGLTGAGAGTAAGAYTGNRDVVIPAESVVTFRIERSGGQNTGNGNTDNQNPGYQNPNNQ